VGRSDWDAVSAYFQGVPARSDRSVAVRVVAENAGSEQFLQRVVDTERDSSLARTLLGARFIVMAWDARGATWAKYVKASQWRVFHYNLHHAERVLADATAIDPSNAAAWTERITVARGLSLGQDEARRRYEQAAEHCDVPYTAQTQLLQTLCPKWGGSLDAIHSFARQCLDAAKPGSLGGAIVAHAHVEHGFQEYGVGELGRYFRIPRVKEEIAAAAAKTVLHPDFRPVHGWVGAHSVFAFAFAHASAHAEAAKHFAALGNRAASYPWSMHDARWMAAFRRARRAARQQ
jgi:hypothetical protein